MTFTLLALVHPSRVAFHRYSLFACGVSALSCGASDDGSGIALLVIDTDVSIGRAGEVPPLVDRLRIDVYAEDGTWIESRQQSRRNERDFPASFSLSVEPSSAPKTRVVRFRAYLEQNVRDYRDTKRLIVDGTDRTPSEEPSPNTTIDRLVRVTLEGGQRGRADITLAGRCFGTPASLPDFETCVDTERVRVPTERLALSSRGSRSIRATRPTAAQELAQDA